MPMSGTAARLGTEHPCKTQARHEHRAKRDFAPVLVVVSVECQSFHQLQRELTVGLGFAVRDCVRRPVLSPTWP